MTLVQYGGWIAGLGRGFSHGWQFEEHTLGATTFTHFADGTGHKTWREFSPWRVGQ